jgi:hypothetical protein
MTYNNSIVSGVDKMEDFPRLQTDMSITSKKLGRDLTGNQTLKNSSRMPQTTRAKLDFSKKTGSSLKKS